MTLGVKCDSALRKRSCFLVSVAHKLDGFLEVENEAQNLACYRDYMGRKDERKELKETITICCLHWMVTDCVVIHC